jgi:hypothetical protein
VPVSGGAVAFFELGQAAQRVVLQVTRLLRNLRFALALDVRHATIDGVDQLSKMAPQDFGPGFFHVT